MAIEPNNINVDNSYNSRQENEVPSLRKKDYDNTRKKYIVFLCAFISRFLGVGFGSMIGIMYVDIVRSFDASRSEASLMESLVRGLMYGGGSFGEIMTRKIGLTKSVLIGCLLTSGSLLAASFSTNITYVVILIGVGTGSGLMLPLISSFLSIGRAFGPLLFPKYISLTITGGAVGSVILPYVAEIMLEEYDWRGTCLLMSAVLANLIVFTILSHFNLPKDGKPEQTKRNNSCDWRILRNPMFLTCLVINIPFGMTGFVETWYLPDFMVLNGFTREKGSFLVVLIGASTVVGTLISGFGHQIGTCARPKVIYHWTYLFLLLAGTHVMFPLFRSYDLLFIASILYGLVFGVILTQSPSVIREAVDESNYPIAQGLIITIYGVSTSIGGVVAGSLTDKTGSYDLVFYLAAGAGIFCSALSTAFLIYQKYKQCFVVDIFRI